MASFDYDPPARPDNLDGRIRHIRGRILDGIEQTLDEMDAPATQRAAIARAVQAQVAPLLCRQATCRRARRCRRTPCTVPQVLAAAGPFTGAPDGS
jgi:hypothetical protein